MDERRQKIIDEARLWLGTPWGQGAVLGESVSCVGLGWAAIKAVGGYDKQLESVKPLLSNVIVRDQMSLIKNLNKFLKRKNPKDMKPGDFLIFEAGGTPCHAAIYTEQNTIIHSHIRERKVVEHSIPPHWKLRGVWSLPDLVD